MKEFTLGFLFSNDRKRVALILKNRGPGGMAGHLNGIGGHMEAFDHSPLDAQVREFWEEAGVTIPTWEYALSFQCRGLVHVFRAFSDSIDLVRTKTDEEVAVWDVKDALAQPNLWENVPWLIPFLLQDSVNNGTVQVTIPVRQARLQCQSSS